MNYPKTHKSLVSGQLPQSASANAVRLREEAKGNRRPWGLVMHLSTSTSDETTSKCGVQGSDMN